MSDEEYRECIEKLVEGGRQWEAMYELQGRAMLHISCIDFAISEAEAERNAITKVCDSDSSAVQKVYAIKALVEKEQEHE